MSLTTYQRQQRTEVEIGLWGTACSGLLFLISAFVEFFTGQTWLSELGGLVGVATITAILVCARHSTVTMRTRNAPQHCAQQL
jgi:hypothetical protein